MSGTTGPVQEYRAVFTDAEGERTTCVAYTPANSDQTMGDAVLALGVWADAMQACSQAQLTEATVTQRFYQTFVKPASGAPGTYDSIEDKAMLEFISESTGQLYLTQIPGPISADFMADEETVDPAATHIAALIAELSANESPKSGVAKDLVYVKGYRRRAKTRRKLRQGISTEIGG